ncbi:ABC transporter permease [Luteibacter sp. 3190]|uniref:ABC transporter permease n=1 Tax=Luteibacter sp. 3190 TaxID=2817736 RepID=UPI0028664494|nr:ABC transporter permease [Luteibacter sp. 3190]MDR6936857.1 lipopolysaccharide transport system permease protein [Luteibacter sp. 3190]
MSDSYQLGNPLSPIVAFARHRTLVGRMAKREIVGRYRGSFIGIFWSFFTPLFMLAVYTFVFGFIFKSRWTGPAAGKLDFAVILFAGMNMHALFAECAIRAPTLIIENSNFVKKVIFPLETLAWTSVAAGLFHLLISTVVLLSFSLLVRGFFPWTVILFPVVVLAYLPFLAGVVWLSASLGVYLRDLKQAVGVIVPVLMFLAPILYPLESIPADLRWLLYLNPLTVVVEAARDVLIWGRMPDWGLLAEYAVASLLFAWGSFAWFERSRSGFADVL